VAYDELAERGRAPRSPICEARSGAFEHFLRGVCVGAKRSPGRTLRGPAPPVRARSARPSHLVPELLSALRRFAFPGTGAFGSSCVWHPGGE